jgi:hypothetical protein
MIQLNHPLRQVCLETSVPEAVAARWLLLIHQIPPQPNYLRVKVRRRLQQLGAVAIKQTVYVLPRSEQAGEDFEWLRAEIVAGGGEAFICVAGFVAGATDAEIEARFREARRRDYEALAAEAEALRESLARANAPERSETVVKARALRRRLAETGALDFFAEPARAEAEAAVAAVESWLRQIPAGEPRCEVATMSEKAGSYSGRTWVTRRGVFVDRTASAWLIRRFIDPRARFKFVPGRTHSPRRGELRFDMFEAEFTHDGDRCTFEVLLERFALDDPGLRAVGEIVHDLDLKETRYGRPETAGVGATLEGIVGQHPEDEERLDRAATLWEGLYTHFRTQGSAAPASARAKGRRGAAVESAKSGKGKKRRPR